MIATIPQSNDLTVSRNANGAGAPLPLIPRRAHSTSHVASKILVPRPNSSLNAIPRARIGEVQSVPHTSVGLHLTVPGSPKDDQAEIPAHVGNRRAGWIPSSSLSKHEMASLSSSISSGSNRQRVQDTHRGGASIPRIHVQGAPPQTSTYQASKPDRPPSPAGHSRLTESRLIRKKSGQLVKPSLKSSTSCSKGGLSVTILGTSSRSEPTTPTLTKMVHFDPQLERVKLFLAEQKPLAVSRDGSPTDDTSGTDSDFPSFIYASASERQARKILSIRVNNMPPSVDEFADVLLEDLSMASEGSSIIGRVRLRNIMYTKRLTTRFTFDDWLTTSEVLGRYLEAIDAAFDRFTFMIRLHDLLPGIEGKTLTFALRYVVAGREIWDNNKGQNYIATFSQQADIGEAGPCCGISALRNKLENVAQHEGRVCQRNSSPTDIPDDNNTTVLTARVPLTRRYDFENSFKKPWTHPIERRTLFDEGKNDFISWQKSAKEDILFMSIPSLGSPREVDADTFATPARSSRNHQRGHFDTTWGAPRIKRTPHRTTLQKKLDDMTPIRSSPVDIECGKSACGLGVLDNSESDDLMPLVAMPSTGSTTSYAYLTENTMTNMAAGEAGVGLNRSPTTNYRRFLSRFCYFTGSGNIQSTLEGTPPGIRRSVDDSTEGSARHNKE